MEAARQKEMKVSITEDATMRRTRSEGGPAVVLEDAMSKGPEQTPAGQFPESAITRGPSVSVCPIQRGVNAKRLRPIWGCRVAAIHLCRRALSRLRQS